MQSSTESGVDADEESKRRQREELMYWNAIRLEKMEKENKAQRPATNRGSSFDDFLEPDKNAGSGTFVYNTGADVNQEQQGLRSRGGVRGLNRSSVYANPFADENHIDWEEQRAIDASLMSPEASERFEVMSEGLYSANDGPAPSRPTISQSLATVKDIENIATVPDPPISYPTDEDMEQSRNFVNMAPRDDPAFASIHAWADNADNSFYSPLPVTRTASPQPEAAAPESPFDDPPESVPGDVTPTYSSSIAGSTAEIWAPRSGATSEGDVMSVDGDGISTPGSWTEVGSVVSDNDVGTGSGVQA